MKTPLSQNLIVYLSLFSSIVFTLCYWLTSVWTRNHKNNISIHNYIRKIMTGNERKIPGVSQSVPLLPFPSTMQKQISVKTESLSTQLLSVEIYAPRWKCWVITVFLPFCLLQCNGGVPLQEPFWISCHPRRPSVFTVLFLCFVLQLMARPREAQSAGKWKLHSWSGNQRLKRVEVAFTKIFNWIALMLMQNSNPCSTWSVRPSKVYIFPVTKVME